MKATHSQHIRAVVVGFALTTLAHAHPGPPGHYHPDEVDEFDQTSVTAPAADKGSNLNLGGILVLLGLGGCVGFALFQKQGGIWKDVTVDH